MRIFLLPLILTAGFVSQAGAQNWSSWRADDTYRGIEVRERCTGFNEFAGRYLWDVQLRNRYERSVDVAWAAEPQRLRGAEAQGDRAVGVAPGETVEGHHTAPVDCSSGLAVRVNDVRAAGTTSTAQARPPGQRVQFQGRWQSHDPEELQKSFTFQFYGDSVTGQWSSPGFNFAITAPVPKNIHGSVSVQGLPQK